ncbi:flagellar biosynthetic protein FliR [Iodidimonas sp. SYSU 1G8]|uniref:flagellar biosynthetic protein FliR n=1 Tax=Iodidimonas sp. SYSU 1G8 TaxID=3133967 RepID=UPI0031FE7E3F
MPADAISALPGLAAGFLVLFARIGSILMLLPAFSEEAVPPRIRLTIALGITLSLDGLLAPRLPVLDLESTALPGLILAELMVGLAVGFIIKVMFQAAAMAGSIIALQIGLSSVLVPDASQGGQSLLLSRFIALAATVACFTAGIHHLWIGAMVRSYLVFPPGVLPPAADFAQLAIATVGAAMSLSLGLAAPLLIYGIIFNVALGLAARLTPTIQVFFIGQPLNILFGLSLFAVLFGTIINVFAQSMMGWMQTAGF